MKKKILSLGVIIILAIMLIALTGCGNSNSENIKRVKEYTNSNFFEGTLDDTLKKGIKGIAYTEEDTSEDGIYYDVSITGNDKETGKKVEIVYRVRDNSVAFQRYKIDDESQGAIAYEKYLKSLSNSDTNAKTNNTNIDEGLLGVWSGESTRNQMCTWTFEKDKVLLESNYGFNSRHNFTGTYEIKENNIIIITSDETGKQTEYEYKIKDGKRLWLIATDGSTSYEDFDLDEKFNLK